MADSDFPGRLLHQACVWENAELLEDLLKNSEEARHVNSVDKYGRTPLHAAAKSANPSLVSVLLNTGADPNLRTSQRTGGETALHIASQYGRLETVARLLSCGARTDIPNARGQTSLDIAVEKKHFDCVEMLRVYQEARSERLQKYSEELTGAFLSGNTELMSELLENVQEDAAIVIDSTKVDGHHLLLRAVMANDAPMVKLLLSKGANANISAADGSALYEAVFRGSREIVNDLLHAAPSMVSKANDMGWLPVHVAIHLQHTHIVERLLTFNYPDAMQATFQDPCTGWTYKMAFDINAVTSDNQTPLYLAVETGNIRLVELLLSKKVASVNDSGESVSISPLQTNLISSNGETALFAAVRLKNARIAKMLLEKGADPNTQMNLSSPPGQTNCLACAVLNSDQQMVNLLLEFKADDSGRHALGAAFRTPNIDQDVLSKILALHVRRDPEFRINKKLMELASAKGFRSASGALSYNAIFPTIPVSVNWQQVQALTNIEESWLSTSARTLNTKVLGGMTLYAITKLDVSGCSLESLPTFVFALQSLRILNASHNKIASFASLNLRKSVTTCQCPVLQEINLSFNQLTSAPEDFFYFPSLVSLDLSNNAIASLPYSMWSAPSLRDLNLSGNQLQTLPVKLDRVNGGLESFQNRIIVSASESSFTDSNTSLVSVEVVSQPIHRKNLWVTRLTLTDSVKPKDTSSEKNASELRTLNLSGNQFANFPAGISCLAPNLTRLIMSYNSLSTMGLMQDFPSGLKHLDVSHNQIEKGPRPAEADELVEYCFGDSSSWKSKKSSSPSELVCAHRAHWRLDNLRTLIVSHNKLTSFEVVGTPTTLRKDRTSSGSSGLLGSGSESGNSLLFPNLTSLDVSFNRLSEIPEAVSNLTALSVLNFDGNPDITCIPAQLGLLPKLWTLNANGCNLEEPLKSMIENKQYKTADILGYLRSSFEKCQPYSRCKLMLVGLENKGKTSLLKAMKADEATRKSKQTDSNWSQRMSGKNQRSSSSQLSTVGIDLGEWHCSVGGKEVTFRTWDFAGQREYYATHQYFLSKRAVYLVVWNLLDSYAGIRDVTQWLVNIQARAPGAAVIIVATHLDEIRGGRFPPNHLENLKREVRERFMGIIDADKHGLPRIAGCVEVSCRTRQNVSKLVNMIHDTAWEMRTPGTNKRLLDQQIPAIYVALEDLISSLASEYRESGQHPVVTAEYFRAIVAHELHERYSMTFRDSAELRQAVMFLHENGILLHYNDSMGLKDLYFLDPQWLCDVLASVITVREVNPFVRKGIMKIEDLQLLFKASKYALIDIQSYILILLNKFEVALKLDAKTLLIPCLLPVKGEGFEQKGDKSPLRIEIKSSGRNWIHFKPFVESPEEKAPVVADLVRDSAAEIRRFYAMLYFPSGFWARLISKLVSEERFHKDTREYYLGEPVATLSLEWFCWQNAVELHYGGNTILKLHTVPPFAGIDLPDSIQLFQANGWKEMRFDDKAVLMITLPVYRKDGVLITNMTSLTMILNRCVNHIDALLEDWYPSLGTRFIHTSTGQYLITKFILCAKCYLQKLVEPSPNTDNQSSSKRSSESSDKADSPVKAFSVEQIILRAVTSYDDVVCPDHGSVKITEIAPETKFLDLPDEKLLYPGEMRRGRVLGRGAFGFVYKATVKAKGSRQMQDVAVKMLVPVDPGFGADAGAVSAFKNLLQKWEHDLLQSYCNAYWTARQELSIITALNHHHIVGFVGLNLQPLGIVLQLAPKGSLLDHLKSTRQNGDQLSPWTVQQICIQVSKALEYLHGFRIIYRDLKSDNILVWQMDTQRVLVKLTDYGISRAVSAASTTKGFAGTEAYIAPEIIQYGGEEEYNEFVDIFSFGMLIYELLNLQQPFDGQDQIKDFVLDGGRPGMAPFALRYPTQMLDLLVVSWSQMPKDRPTSSQALSICNTPEFSHLQDVAVLEDFGLNIVQGRGIQALAEGLFVAMSDGTLNLVSCNAYNWTESKAATFQSGTPVTQCLVLPDCIWVLRDKEVSTHCLNTLELIETFSLRFGDQSDFLIDGWISMPERKKVLASTSTNKLFLLHADARLRKNSQFIAMRTVAARIRTMFVVSKDIVLGGCDGGQIMIIMVHEDALTEQQLVSVPGTNLEVAAVVGSSQLGLAWSFLKEDATLYSWKLVMPSLHGKLDCDRLIPVSESLHSIGLPDNGELEAKRHLSCMCFLDGLLYLGTVWGTLIVVNGATLAPVSVIRPHAGPVVGIVAVPFSDGPRVVTVGHGYRDVVSRFLNHDNVRQNISPVTLCALMWRTSDWSIL